MNWFNEEMKKFENDPQYIAEGKLLELTEAICKIKQPVGINKLLFKLMEKIASKLIWKNNKRRKYEIKNYRSDG